MKTNNRAKEVFAMIKEYSKVNEQERAEIDRRLKEENEKEADAKEAARVAQETLNDEAYLDAQNALACIEARKRMLHGRADQIDSLRRITEEQSDAVIDSLKEYMNSLSETLKHDAEPHISALLALYEAYAKSMSEADDAITSWTARVHPNYRSSYTMYQRDGKMTNRSSCPVPVFSGNKAPFCQEALNIHGFLKSMNKLW